MVEPEGKKEEEKFEFDAAGEALEYISLHWHIMVRRESDPDPKSTIWESRFPKVKQSDEDFLTTAEEIRRKL